MAFVLGKDCKAYRNSGTFGAPTWVEVSNVSGLKTDMKSDTGEGTRRASGRFKQYAGTVADVSVTWKMLWDLLDGSFAAMLAAFQAATEIDMIFLDGDRTAGSHQGPRISSAFKNFSRTEDEKGIVTVDVEVVPGIGFVAVWFTGSA